LRSCVQVQTYDTGAPASIHKAMTKLEIKKQRLVAPRSGIDQGVLRAQRGQVRCLQTNLALLLRGLFFGLRAFELLILEAFVDLPDRLRAGVDLVLRRGKALARIVTCLPPGLAIQCQLAEPARRVLGDRVVAEHL
jgi:hypothetical protein